jgi:hypothetical protein
MELSILGFIDFLLCFTLYYKTTILSIPTSHPFASHRPTFIHKKSIPKELRKLGLAKLTPGDFPPDLTSSLSLKTVYEILTIIRLFTTCLRPSVKWCLPIFRPDDGTELEKP